MHGEKWNPNTILIEFSLKQVYVWIQLWNLPIEYQFPHLVVSLDRICGEFFQVDRQNYGSKKHKLVRIKVFINPEKPFVHRITIRHENEVLSWTEFRYEKTFKICRNCSIIGHTKPRCKFTNLKVEKIHNSQMESICTCLRFYKEFNNVRIMVFMNKLSMVLNIKKDTTKVDSTRLEDGGANQKVVQ